MAVKIGSDDLAAMYVGSEEVVAAYVGDEQVYNAFSLTYVTSAISTTDTGTYTFSDLDLGGATPSRIIIVGVGARINSGSHTLDSVTIGGVSATKIAGITNNTSGTDLTEIWAAQVPSGTSGDVVATFSTTMQRAAVSVWRMTGKSAITASDTDTATVNASSSATVSTSIDVPAGGVAISANSGSRAPTSWSGLTERFDQDIEAGTGWTVADEEFASTQTGLSVSNTGSDALGNKLMVTASWGP